MAIINKEAKTVNRQLQFDRQYAGSLDKSEIFYSLTDAREYAQTSPIAYVGQTIKVVDETSGKTTAYVIQNTAGALLALATGSSGNSNVDGDIGSLDTRISTLEINTVKKTGQTSQTIEGDVTIGGNFIVKGTSSVVDVQNLKVEDNLIVTNSTNAVSTGYSGLAIVTGAIQGASYPHTYGIVYDHGAGVIRLGEGTVNKENADFQFSFNNLGESNGQAIATRSDDTAWKDKEFAVWDSTNFKFIPDTRLSFDANGNLIVNSITLTGNKGTVTSITAGSGLTGGTISESGTIAHYTPTDGTKTELSGAKVIQNITKDGFGHIVGIDELEVVDLTSEQSISGVKTFTNGLKTDTITSTTGNALIVPTAGGTIATTDDVTEAIKDIDYTNYVTLNTTQTIPGSKKFTYAEGIVSTGGFKTSDDNSTRTHYSQGSINYPVDGNYQTLTFPNAGGTIAVTSDISTAIDNFKTNTADTLYARLANNNTFSARNTFNGITNFNTLVSITNSNTDKAELFISEGMQGTRYKHNIIAGTLVENGGSRQVGLYLPAYTGSYTLFDLNIIIPRPKNASLTEITLLSTEDIIGDGSILPIANQAGKLGVIQVEQTLNRELLQGELIATQFNENLAAHAVQTDTHGKAFVVLPAIVSTETTINGRKLSDSIKVANYVGEYSDDTVPDDGYYVGEKVLYNGIIYECIRRNNPVTAPNDTAGSSYWVALSYIPSQSDSIYGALEKNNTWTGTNSFTDETSFNGSITSNIVPKYRLAYSLGAEDKEWNNIYATNVYGTPITDTITTKKKSDKNIPYTLTLPNESGIIATQSFVESKLSNVDLTDYGKLDGANTWTGTNSFENTVSFSGSITSSILPETTLRYSLGSSTKRWNDIYASTIYGILRTNKIYTEATIPGINAPYTITLPEKTGTIALLSDIPSVPTYSFSTELQTITPSDTAYWAQHEINGIVYWCVKSEDGLAFEVYNQSGARIVTQPHYIDDELYFAICESTLTKPTVKLRKFNLTTTTA